MLDLVLSNLNPTQIEVFEGAEPLVPIDKYHPPLEVTIRFSRGRVVPVPPPASTQATVNSGSNHNWNWRKAEVLDWTDVLATTNINSAVELLYNKLYSCINQYVPLKCPSLIRSKYNYPNWYTKEIIHHIKLKYMHLKRYKVEGKEFNREMFKYYRWHVKALIDNAFRLHLKLTQGNIIKDPVQFWTYVKDKKKDRQTVGTYSHHGERVVRPRLTLSQIISAQYLTLRYPV